MYKKIINQLEEVKNKVVVISHNLNSAIEDLNEVWAAIDEDFKQNEGDSIGDYYSYWAGDDLDTSDVNDAVECFLYNIECLMDRLKKYSDNK